jgi:hypothetical protein
VSARVHRLNEGRALGAEINACWRRVSAAFAAAAHPHSPEVRDDEALGDFAVGLMSAVAEALDGASRAVLLENVAAGMNSVLGRDMTADVRARGVDVMDRITGKLPLIPCELHPDARTLDVVHCARCGAWKPSPTAALAYTIGGSAIVDA